MGKKMLILGVYDGEGFPESSGRLQIKATLRDVCLESDFVCGGTRPDFNTELAWQTDRGKLRALRANKEVVRFEVWQDSQPIGHQVLSVRTARAGAQPQVVRLLGTKQRPPPSLRVSLSIEDANNQEAEDSSRDSLSEAAKAGLDSARHAADDELDCRRLQPVHVEKPTGHFRIGPESRCDTMYTLTLAIIYGRNLDLLVPPDLVVTEKDRLYFYYKMLGAELSTQTFSGLKEPKFLAERASAKIRSSVQLLNQYITESPAVHVAVCFNSTVIGKAELSMLNMLGTGDMPREFKGSVPVLTPEGALNKNGGVYPELGVGLYLDLYRGDSADYSLHHSSSDFSNSQTHLDADQTDNGNVEEMDVDSQEGVVDANSRRQAETAEPPPTAPPSPPTKLPPSPRRRAAAADLNGSVVPPQSETIGLGHSVPTLAAVKKYKFTVELLSVRTATEHGGVVISYKYPAFSRERISTGPGFAARSNELTTIPRGYCEFMFAATEQKLSATLRSHPLRILFSGDQGRIAEARLSFDNLLDNFEGKKRGVFRSIQDIVSDNGQFFGRLTYRYKIKSLEDGVEEITIDDQANDEPAKDERVSHKNMMEDAARELEKWKLAQQEAFRRHLQAVEKQHIDVLGQEWKKREKEREKLHAEKMEIVSKLEDDHRKALELSKREHEALKKEKEQLEVEKTNLKECRGGLIEKLKSQLRENQAVLAQREADVALLEKKLKQSEAELASLEKSRQSKRNRDDETATELIKLRAEKQTWGERLEQACKAKVFYKQAWEQVKGEMSDLRSARDIEQSARIKELTSEVGRLRDELVYRAGGKKLRRRHDAETTSDASMASDAGTQRTESVFTAKSPRKSKQLSNGALSFNQDLSSPLSSKFSDQETRLADDETPRPIDVAKEISRLEEERDLLLRTGVYTRDDIIVQRIQTKINNLLLLP